MKFGPKSPSLGRIKIKRDGLRDVLKGINDLTKQRVLVGIPGETAERDQDEYGPMNNATLGYIHDNGSPAANIPARPFLKEGIEEGEEAIAAQLKKAAQAALDGDDGRMEKRLHAAGLEAQAAVKEKLNSGPFEPLADSTLRARAGRGRKGAAEELASRAAGNAPNADNARPLVDTGQLRNSITYVIRKK